MPYRFDERPFFDARMAIHVFLAAVPAWLGIALLLPAPTFPTSPAWRLFQQTATEQTWGIILFAGALTGALGIDSAHKPLKIVSILLLATLHGTLALLFLIGNPMGGASGTYGLIALLGYYLAFRQVRWGTG